MKTLIEQGERLFAEGDDEAAEICFGEALARNPEDKAAHNNLGVIAFRRKNARKALEHLEASLKIDPFYKEAVLNYCEVLSAVAQPDNAAPVLKKAMQRYAHDPEVRAFLDDRIQSLPQTRSVSYPKPSPVADIAFPRPIIIGGCGSSGTTLLKTMLDAHGKIACGPELSFFDRPVLYRTEIGDLHRMFRTQRFEDLEKELHFPMKTPAGTYFGLYRPNAGRRYHSFDLIEEMFRMARDLKHFLDLFFSNHAEKQQKTRWAEKTPNNVFCVDQVLRLYPDAVFVHVIRDGRDVALSLVEKRKFSLRAAIYRWLLAVEAGIRHRGHARYLEVRYEDLVLNTENTLRNLMESVEAPFDPNMLAFWKKGKNNFKGYGATPVFTGSVGRWKTAAVAPHVGEQMDWMLSDKLKKLGYVA